MISMCGVELKDRKRSQDLMLILGLNEYCGAVGYVKQCSLIWSCVEQKA